MNKRQPSNELSAYLSRVSRLPRLSAEKERELALRWRDQRDQRAANELVSANLRHVVATALRYRAYRVPLNELVSEGNIGLLQALDKFDPERGIRFVTYAAFWVRARIVRFILDSWSVTRSGGGALRSKVFFKLRRERARAATLFGEGAEADAAAAEKLGISLDELRRMANQLDSRDVSLNQELFHGEPGTLVDRLPSPTIAHDDELAQRQSERALRLAVQDALKELDPRELYIAEKRFMADADTELSLADIGRELGISRERARQLAVRAQAKLKKALLQSLGRIGQEPAELLSAA
jgi:RNA polymerase sigma-32 factor